MISNENELFISDDFLKELMGWEECLHSNPLLNLLVGNGKAKTMNKCLEHLRIENPRWDRVEYIDRIFSSSTPLASTALKHLVLEVDKFNNTVNNVFVLDRLREVGNPVAFSDREKIINALRLTREDLVRAIKTEKILRENPNFRPEKFSNNIAALEAMQISDRANSYGEYFDETMQIAVSVQDELKALLGS